MKKGQNRKLKNRCWQMHLRASSCQGACANQERRGGADVGQRHPATNNQKLLDLADEAFLPRDDDQVTRRVLR